MNKIKGVWRPALALLYGFICLLDFAIFPVTWNALQVWLHQTPTIWQAITLQGAGIFHISFGAILGVTAYGRTKEKIAHAEYGGLDAESEKEIR